MEPGKLQSAAQGAYPAAWSFTGPPPGMAAQPQPVNFYQPFPPGGFVAMPPQPQMGVAVHQTMPHMQPHPPPPHWMGAMAQPFPMTPVAAVCPSAHQQMERKYANKKERDKAKKERKEARKLAENPLQPMTEDAKPRAFLNDGERQETLQWIEDRKARFPTRERIANAADQAKALSQAGGSGKGQTACDTRLFAVLQEQHRLGLLRSAGTEDLYRSLGSQGTGRGMGSKRGRGKGRGQGRGQGQQHRSSEAVTSEAQTRAQPSDPEVVQAAVETPSSDAAQRICPAPNIIKDTSLQCPDEAADKRTTPSCAIEHNRDSDAIVDEPNKSVKVEFSAAPALDTGSADVENDPVNVHISVSSHAMPESVAEEINAAQNLDKEPTTQRATNKRKASDTSASAGHNGARKATKGQAGWQRADAQQMRRGSKPCLLHRLLAADVRQDRSLLLQAFRFFVENDFLQSAHETPLKFPDTAQ